jgi:hypothetical protein
MILQADWKHEIASMLNVENHSDLTHQLCFELERRFRFLQYYQLKVEARKILNELIEKRAPVSVAKPEVNIQITKKQLLGCDVLAEQKHINTTLVVVPLQPSKMIGVFDILKPVTYEKRFSSGV